ncbi:hypothetical protein B566_EDAN014628 [Ephemera danica]|nr:hypothetical protein B566_EDAN014628 [Ephemera danica]
MVWVMNVAVSADDGTQQEWGVDQWMASCNCKDDRNIELFKEFSAFSRELINNCSNKEQRWKSEQMQLMSQAAEYKLALHQLNQSNAQAAAEWRREKLDLSLKLQNNEQELTKMQQCVGVRCYDVKSAQDMKAHNSLTAIAMYDDLITKLTPCLKASNISIQQIIDEKADIYIKLKDLEKTLLTAARDGNVQMIRSLIANGVNINATDKDKNSGLILASRHNYKAIVKDLIDAGAYLDTRNINNETALFLAVYNNYTEICKMVLDAGADANTQNMDSYSALSYTIIKYNLNVFKMLIEKGAEVNPKTIDGITPLHTVAKYGHIDMAKILVEHGAKLNVTMVANDEGRTPLGRALYYNQAQMVRYLMSIGATD